MGSMSEETENPTAPTAVTTPVEPVEPAPTAAPVVVDRRPNRLFQALAWVGIAAGTVFVFAVVFFSGFILGKTSDGGHHGGPHREFGMFHREGGVPMGPPHFSFHGGPGGPGEQNGPGGHDWRDGQQGGPGGPAERGGPAGPGEGPGPGNGGQPGGQQGPGGPGAQQGPGGPNFTPRP